MAEWRVRWSSDAVDDLDAIADFIAKDNPPAAEAILLRLQTHAESLAQMPERGRTVPELPKRTQFPYRELIDRPWRIVYFVDGTQVRILAVVDGRRDFVDWLESTHRFE